MKRNTWWTLSAFALCTVPALAQQTPRPDAGTTLPRERQTPALPAPGGAPTVVVPAAPPAATFDNSIRATPTAFRIQGNTLFSEAQLQAAVAEFVGKPTNMEGLVQAATAVRRYYRDRGYLLTEAYLPQQQFAASGGVVTIQVLEARVGRVAVRVEGEGISQSLANRIVTNHLHTGDHISEYSLDKPILLLRDLVGFDAAASVEPGTNVGEADITVTVKPYGPRVDGSIGVDNFGIVSAGEYRGYVNANLNNPTGNGDLLSARIQASDKSGSNLYRLGYSIAVGGYATRIGLNATKTEYALGRSFASLGATGEATVLGLSVTHPFIRSRTNNVLGAITLERKELEDVTATPATFREQKVDAVRLSVLGNFVDNLLTGSFNSYAINVMRGDVELDPGSLAVDVAGARTAGNFWKLNVEYVRTMYFSANSRLITSFQAQASNKNLPSAEKFGIGGINGVRGYPVGDQVGIGDTGAVLNVEYQHQLPQVWGVPLTGSVFFDVGRVYPNRRQYANLFNATFSETLSSAGLGLTAGTFGKYLINTQVAWRTDSTRPVTEPDRKPRFWFSLQKWL